MTATPKRSVGVTLTAVVSILGSAVVILFAILMLVAAFFQTAQPASLAYAKVFLVIESLVFGGLAAWGIATTVGLFRLRGWARWSVIIFGALLVLFGLPGALAMAVIHLPEAPGAPPAIMTVVKAAMIGFYLLLALLGAWWLYLFQTSAVRAQFGAGTEGPGGRPLSLSIIAWLLIVGGAMCLVGVFVPYPAMLFGLMLRGWAARLFFLAFAAMECWLGVGLLRLKPLSRILTIALFAFAFVNSLLIALLPGYPERIRAMMEVLPGGWPGADQPATLASTQPAMVVGVLLCAVPIWFLVARRSAFRSEQVGRQQAL